MIESSSQVSHRQMRSGLVSSVSSLRWSSLGEASAVGVKHRRDRQGLTMGPADVSNTESEVDTSWNGRAVVTG